MSLSADRPLPDILQESYESFRHRGFGPFLASTYRALLGGAAVAQIPEVLDSFAHLRPDPHMGDGGSYRFRGYSRYRLEREGSVLTLERLGGHSIYQTAEDNPVNGGVVRTFEPLDPGVAEGPLLRALIETDFAHASICAPELADSAVAVGVHQVRIVANPDAIGLPTPEGIHRDSEAFTFQHFMARKNITGGEFRAYDDKKELAFAWLQEQCLDTVMFQSSTWHSATPVTTVTAGVAGYRDIFLVDFDPL
jgi:hypothetical protein